MPINGLRGNKKHTGCWTKLDRQRLMGGAVCKPKGSIPLLGLIVFKSSPRWDPPFFPLFLLLGFSTTCMCTGADGASSHSPPQRLQIFLRSPRRSDAIWDTQSFPLTPNSPPRSGYSPETWGISIGFPNILHRPPSTSR